MLTNSMIIYRVFLELEIIAHVVNKFPALRNQKIRHSLHKKVSLEHIPSQQNLFNAFVHSFPLHIEIEDRELLLILSKTSDRDAVVNRASVRSYATCTERRSSNRKQKGQRQLNIQIVFLIALYYTRIVMLGKLGTLCSKRSQIPQS
jgi:hypothetical protein